MANESPQVDNDTSVEFLERSKEKIVEISGGKLTDFSPQSVLTALLESQSLVAGAMQQKLNSLAGDIEQNRLKIFGIERIPAKKSTGTILVTLNGLYPSVFQLPQGFRLNINNLVFETISTLILPEFVNIGEVPIESLETGVINNIQNEDIVISYPYVEQILKIEVVGDITGGIDEESKDNYDARVYEFVRSRDTLVSEEDFENDLKDYLGEGAGVLAIGRLRPDLTNYANGYVHVFGLNPDGSDLNSEQVSQLQDYYTSKVAMATVSVRSLSKFDLDVGVILTFNSRFSAELLAQEIKALIEDYMKPANTAPGMQILSKSIEYRIQNQIEGVLEGVINVTLNGLAQPIDMPEAWFVPELRTLELGLIPQGTSSAIEFIFNY